MKFSWREWYLSCESTGIFGVTKLLNYSPLLKQDHVVIKGFSLALLWTILFLLFHALPFCLSQILCRINLGVLWFVYSFWSIFWKFYCEVHWFHWWTGQISQCKCSCFVLDILHSSWNSNLELIEKFCLFSAANVSVKDKQKNGGLKTAAEYVSATIYGINNRYFTTRVDITCRLSPWSCKSV